MTQISEKQELPKGKVAGFIRNNAFADLGGDQKVVTTTEGNYWKIEVKQTTRTPIPDSKLNDMVETEITLSGHTNTSQDAQAEAILAKQHIIALLHPKAEVKKEVKTA